MNVLNRPIGKWERFLIRAPAWPAVLLAAIVFLDALWSLRLPEMALRGFWFSDWYFGSCLVALAPRAIQLFLRKRAESGIKPFAREFRSRVPAFPFLLALLIAASYAAEKKWPLELGFRFSESAFAALARQALNSPTSQPSLGNRWAGVYPVISVEVVNANTVLIKTGVYWSYSFGFVLAPGWPQQFARAEDLQLPESLGKYEALERMRGNWFVLYSVYVRAKSGWS